MATNATPSARPRTLPPRDARGRFVAVSGAASATSRACAVPSREAGRRGRVLPSRDARGRFAWFPTTNAPSWYVLAADGYRIPGEVEGVPMQRDASAAPQPLPPAKVVRRRRSRMQPYEVATWISLLLGLVGMYWYALHLPVPHH